jgi:N utilization substance protein A
MQSSDLVSSFGEIARAKDIDRDALQLIVEDVFRAMIEKRYGADEGFEIIFNPDEGDIQILHIREVVEDWNLEDPVTQIEESDAKQIDEFFEVGEEVPTELKVEDFGRRAVMTGQQALQQKIRDIEKEQIYEEYSDLVGEIVVGEIRQTRSRNVLLVKDEVEMALPRKPRYEDGEEVMDAQHIPGEFYRKGDMLRAVVKEVKRDAGSDPQVIVSRAEEVFMQRLFELEVPEVYEGIVEIKKIARIPGERAKVAVETHDERVDPVGACVGVKGVRIHAVVRELDNENIDVLLWDDDPAQLIVNALSPANPVDVRINDEAEPPRARVDVPADEVSQAIGRRGVNIRLASKLTEYEIDVYRDIPEDEEDIEIGQFGDVLSPQTIEALKVIGCDTGKAVLELDADEMARRAGEPIDQDTAERIIEIIETEFAREEQHLFEQDFVLEAAGTTMEESEMSVPELPGGAPDGDEAPAESPAASSEAPAPLSGSETDLPESETDLPESEPAGADEEGEVNTESASEDAVQENVPAPTSVTDESQASQHRKEEQEGSEGAPPEETPADEEAAVPDATPAPNVTPDEEEKGKEPTPEEETA